MIFVTVGSQLPFDRLVRTMDEWAGRNRDCPVFAQIGDSALRPAHLQWCATMVPRDYERRLHEAEFVVAHAGMGTILSGLERGKRLVLLPRRARDGEHRNDHQLATAKHFARLPQVLVAADEAELPALVDRLRAGQDAGAPAAPPAASPRLLAAIREFVLRP